MIRKDKHGDKTSWKERDGKLRMQLLPFSYLEKEAVETLKYNKLRSALHESSK